MTPNANGIPCPPLQKKTNHRLSLPTPCSGSSLSTGGWWSRVPRVGCGAVLSHLGWGRACLPGMTSISSDPSHPPHPALVPWTHFPGGKPAANWTAGPSGWVRGWTGWSNRPGDQRDLGQGQPGLSGNLVFSPRSVFLVRESQRNPQGFVLSLCHLQKVKHYLILPVSNAPHSYFGFL